MKSLKGDRIIEKIHKENLSLDKFQSSLKVTLYYESSCLFQKEGKEKENFVKNFLEDVKINKNDSMKKHCFKHIKILFVKNSYKIFILFLSF